ncbi:EamA family transporter RarD [Nocardia stercoris]|uniref:EamA family transporter RarD n=1 Tax=Nocardia stercoris TaxID=2483361 RepID=A0A3M2KWY4_9NOCA|nr:EamA family transporter RarD [Nocardia stercoris]RMI29146.1 EamA family transporter RarD [Nocardia stercoris]
MTTEPVQATPPELPAGPAPGDAPVRGGLRAGSGALLATGAYFIWGLFPGFFGLLSFADPFEVLAQRMLWTLVVALAALAMLGRVRELWAIPARTWRLAAAASAAIAVNWGVYVYGVGAGHVVECALGYFAGPLVTVLLGLVVFRERLSAARWAALALGAAAVLVLTVDYGHPPWIALALAFSFALYGLIKKVIVLDPLPGLAAEGIVAAPVGLAVVVGFAVTGHAAFGHGIGHTALLMACGPVTLIPLVLFASAARRTPLSTMGILQYLTPALQMAWGVLVNHEPMPAARWAGFGLIWVALVVFSADVLRAGRAVPSGRSGAETVAAR